MAKPSSISEFFAQQEYPRNEHAGYVYVVEFGNLHTKIGRSQTPRARIAALATQAGIDSAKIWVSPLCYNYKSLELEMHAIFRSKRKIGEYFEIAFDDALIASENLRYDMTTDDVDAELDAAAAEARDRIVRNISMFARAIAAIGGEGEKATQDDIKRHAGRMSVDDASVCLGVSVDDVVATIGMSLDDFAEFGPLVESGRGIMLNDMHVSYLVILLPTTDRLLPLKLHAARRLASTYHDESLGIVREAA